MRNVPKMVSTGDRDEDVGFEIELEVRISGNVPDDLREVLEMSAADGLVSLIGVDFLKHGANGGPDGATIRFVVSDEDYKRMLDYSREPFDQYFVHWVTTPDGYEDCFIVARTEEEACEAHEEMEGYELGESSAERVCQVPRGAYTAESVVREHEAQKGNPVSKQPSFWPHFDVLKACGFEILSVELPYRARFGDREFVWCVSDAIVAALEKGHWGNC